MIEVKDKKKCMGCMACYNICPKDAIKMKLDEEGFKYPIIDKDKCINCKLCEKVCPIINKTINNNYKNPQVYAVWSKNEITRLDSTSGGTFSELANTIFNDRGYICGAIYNKEWLVEHTITNDKDNISKLRSSKYLQSEMKDCYKKIQNLLKNGHTVLFCGSPCQVAALKKYLKDDYDNLYTCDFICRGMNSPKIFKMYISNLEKKYKSKIIDIKFKNKKFGWHHFNTRICFENGKKYYGVRYLDSYMRGYLKYNAFMRPACYDCKFKGVQRYSDITLADFWGIENINRKLDEDKGTSMVLVNSDKGEKLLKKASDKLEITKIDSSKSFISNVCTYKSPEMTEYRKNVMENIDKMTYEQLNKKFFPNASFSETLKYKFIINKIGKRIYNKLLHLKIKLTKKKEGD